MRNILNLLLVVAFNLTGCALSPQTVVINPDIQVDNNAAGTKVTRINLEVVDKRSSNIIGQRGGVYEATSHISTDDNMTGTLQKKLAKAFTEIGYIVAANGEAADAGLTVEISNIKYIAHSEKVIKSIETKVEMRTICRKNSQEYTGTYNATRKKDVITTPGIEENEKLVNEALAIVLQRIVKDDELFAFLDGQNI
ncbi:MAG: hypothetical protein HY356_05805 [Gammaproteobacteria bacterium]|nr:hypothetical protein [Gammaproteobacteria bacterium]